MKKSFNYSDVIVGYYKLPVELFYKSFSYETCAKEGEEDEDKLYFDDIYILCTKKNKNSTDITWRHYWGKRLSYCDSYSDVLFDYLFGVSDFMPMFTNLPNNGLKSEK